MRSGFGRRRAGKDFCISLLPCILYKEDEILHKEALARIRMHVETATYKPSISDLDGLARFFGVPIAVFFPGAQPASRANVLISATADLDERDLEEVTLYARFRRAQRAKRRG